MKTHSLSSTIARWSPSILLAVFTWLAQGTALAAVSQARLLSPANNAVNVSPCTSLVWQKASGATGYEYELKIGNTVVATGGSGGATNVAVTLLDNTTYSWRVRGRTSQSDGAWSATWTFTTKPAIPAPGLLTPADGQSFAGNSVTLSWQAEASATGYDYEVYQNAVLITSGSNGGSLSANLQLSPGTFQWRVRGKTSCRTGTWSALRTFSAGALGAPVQMSPPSQSSVPGPNVTFNWQTVSGATGYTLEIWQNGNVLHSLNRTPSTTVNLATPGTYQWRVRAYNSSMTGPWSATWGFSTVAASLIVNAGPDITIPTGASGSITATAQAVNTPPPNSWTWEKVSGPGVVYSANFFAPKFDFGVSASGTYLLKVTASNGQISGWDTVSVTVLTPVLRVNAGPDQYVPFPWTASLAGDVLLDDRPNLEIVTRWKCYSGPGAVTFSDAGLPTAQTTASQLGLYKFRLEARYRDMYAQDTMYIGFGVPRGNPPVGLGVFEDLQPHLETKRDTNGAFHLTILSPDSRPCIIQRTENLVTWADWQTVTPTNGLLTLVDAEPAGACRFYRLKVE